MAFPKLHRGNPHEKLKDSWKYAYIVQIMRIIHYAGKMLGVGGPDYTLEAEIKDGLFHKRGVLAAARQGDEVNPERRSSGSQFYIVWGKVYNEGQLRQFSKQLKMQKIQSAFNQLAAQHREEIMQMRRERNRAGLQELQDKLAAEKEQHPAGCCSLQLSNKLVRYLTSRSWMVLPAPMPYRSSRR